MQHHRDGGIRKPALAPGVSPPPPVLRGLARLAERYIVARAARSRRGGKRLEASCPRSEAYRRREIFLL